MYENKGLWDPRSIMSFKAMLMPTEEWLSVFYNPSEHNLIAGYREYDNECSIQGLITSDAKYFLREATLRYTISGQSMTMVEITDYKNYADVKGYSKNFLNIRESLPNEDKKFFSDAHTWTTYAVLAPKFRQYLRNYNVFINRFLKLNSWRNNINQCYVLFYDTLTDYLTDILKEKTEFTYYSWETYSEGSINRPLFEPKDINSIIGESVELCGGLNLRVTEVINGGQRFYHSEDIKR